MPPSTQRFLEKLRPNDWLILEIYLKRRNFGKFETLAVKSHLFIAILEKSLYLPFLGDFGSFLGLIGQKDINYRLHIQLKYLLIQYLIKKYFPTRYDMTTFQKSSIFGIFGDFGHFLGILGPKTGQISILGQKKLT